jgi:hypothetical protein
MQIYRLPGRKFDPSLQRCASIQRWPMTARQGSLAKGGGSVHFATPTQKLSAITG